ncbi:oligosaccharide flippase family protein [Neobacillus drentensis]|uniref:oligosaccharide flippase family protein n=1 Tax=Neobacillus drentensis TaxID=220684 RepID=UPI002FFD8AB3
MESESKNRFFKGTLYVFIIKLLGAGLAFLTQVILSKSLGIESYGSLSIFLSLANIMIVLPLIGMDTAIIRSVAGTDEKNQRKWFLTISLKITTLLLAIVLLTLWIGKSIIFSSFDLDPELGIYLVLYVIVLSYSKILDGFFQGEKKTVLANIFSSFLNNLMKVVLLVAVFSITLGLQTTVIVLLAVEMVLVFIRLIYVAKGYLDVTTQPKGQVKEYVRYSIPLFFVASISIVLLSLDKFILSYMMGNFEVGILRIFENYAAILALFVSPFVTMWPIMSEYYQKNKMDDLKELFKQSTLVIATLILPAWVTLTVCTEEILEIFGVNATQVDNIRLIMFLFFLGTVYDAIIGPAGALLSMTKYSKINLINNILLFALNVVLSVILISKMGLLGAAISFSASKIFINTLNVYQNKRLFNLFPYGKLHLLLIAVGIPIYYIGTATKAYLNAGTIINIAVVGVLAYLLYFGLFILINRESAKKLWLQVKKKKNA